MLTATGRSRRSARQLLFCADGRSEERRVGKECRSRWWPDHSKKNGAMSKLFGCAQKAASGGIQGDALATDNNIVGIGDSGFKSSIQGSTVPFFFFFKQKTAYEITR